MSVTETGVVIGGTYTRLPYDKDFFSTFQSVFIHYSETKNKENPDYIAAHTMIIDNQTFRKSGGFPEDFFPIIEDVEFSHRMQRSGCKLIMNPEIQVKHIFNFSLLISLRNAFKKSYYWNMYSLKNKDLFADSGTASFELKTNVATNFFCLFLIALWGISQNTLFLYLLPLIYIFNLFANRCLLKAFYETKGILFAGLALIYYTMIYPLPIGMGTITGIVKYIFKAEHQ